MLKLINGKYEIGDQLPNDVSIYRPMVVIAGSSDQPQESMGAFQEFPQVNSDICIIHRKLQLIIFGKVESARLFSKYAARIPSLDRVPFFVEKVGSILILTKSFLP
jgi:hypothetical protein